MSYRYVEWVRSIRRPAHQAFAIVNLAFPLPAVIYGDYVLSKNVSYDVYKSYYPFFNIAFLTLIAFGISLGVGCKIDFLTLCFAVMLALYSGSHVFDPAYFHINCGSCFQPSCANPAELNTHRQICTMLMMHFIITVLSMSAYIGFCVKNTGNMYPAMTFRRKPKKGPSMREIAKYQRDHAEFL